MTKRQSLRKRGGLSALLAAALLLGSFLAVPPARGQDLFRSLRRQMVDEQIRGRGISDPAVLRAMAEVPRHLFVPASVRGRAYADQALPIGEEQTVPQPYLVALMASLLDLDRGDRVLEIGTGTGYQAAVMARLAREVYTIEILEPLGRKARQTLQELGYENVHVRIADGRDGWPEAAPFDAVLVSVASDAIPDALLRQLKVGGRLVMPLGRFFQDLRVVTKTARGLEERSVIPVRFDPMLEKSPGG